MYGLISNLFLLFILSSFFFPLLTEKRLRSKTKSEPNRNRRYNISGLHGLLCSDLQKKRERGDSLVSLKTFPHQDQESNYCNKDSAPTQPYSNSNVTRSIDDHGHYVPVPGQG